uniref:Replication protein A 70 kDa DNA-binding subunit B/D first OB fold domain-containing protein n=1 Tax=Brassica oleracea TaxID=3712 RepID=A0A3P6GBF1_BRAOL|nr:unnamed protein product [Brassica oleracea]
MNSLMPFTLLSDVKPFKCGWKKAYLESKGRLLPVGVWRNIQNFALSHATGIYRPTEDSYKMSFVHNTTITRSNNVKEDIFLSLVDFQFVMSGSLQPCFLIDVITQVVELGELERIQIPCCLWGKYAEIMYEGCTQNEDGMTVCLIRFAKIGRCRGEIQLCNVFEAFDIVINPPIAEADAFKELLTLHLIVKDDTGEARLMLLDMLEDHDDLPDAIIQIGCKTSLSESMLTRITLFMVPGFTRLEGSIKI